MNIVIICTLGLFLLITLYKVSQLSERELELQEQVAKLNRDVWDLHSENLSIRSQIQSANDKAKTWQIHAENLMNEKNVKSTRGKGNN